MAAGMNRGPGRHQPQAAVATSRLGGAVRISLALGASGGILSPQAFAYCPGNIPIITGSVYNAATLDITDCQVGEPPTAGELSNTGTLTNNGSLLITAAGTLDNQGSTVNQAYLDNAGALLNTGSLLNAGNSPAATT